MIVTVIGCLLAAWLWPGVSCFILKAGSETVTQPGSRGREMAGQKPDSEAAGPLRSARFSPACRCIVWSQGLECSIQGIPGFPGCPFAR